MSRSKSLSDDSVMRTRRPNGGFVHDNSDSNNDNDGDGSRSPVVIVIRQKPKINPDDDDRSRHHRRHDHRDHRALSDSSRSRSPRKERRHTSRHGYRSRSRSDRRRHRAARRSRSSRPPADTRVSRYKNPVTIASRDNPSPSRCVGVFGLSRRTEERQLWAIFERFGPIESIQLVMDRHTRTSQGFGFIYFEDVDSATKAKVEANGMEIDGRTVRIDFSITRKAHTPTPGVYMGKRSSGYRGRYEDRDRDERYRRESYGRKEYSSRRRSRSRSITCRRSSSRSYGSYTRRIR